MCVCMYERSPALTVCSLALSAYNAPENFMLLVERRVERTDDKEIAKKRCILKREFESEREREREVWMLLQYDKHANGQIDE